MRVERPQCGRQPVQVGVVAPRDAVDIERRPSGAQHPGGGSADEHVLDTVTMQYVEDPPDVARASGTTGVGLSTRGPLLLELRDEGEHLVLRVEAAAVERDRDVVGSGPPSVGEELVHIVDTKHTRLRGHDAKIPAPVRRPREPSLLQTPSGA